VVVDPGHGGVDPGNPSLYLPRGVKEKDVALFEECLKELKSKFGDNPQAAGFFKAKDEVLKTLKAGGK